MIDIVYTFHYKPNEIRQAIKRLRCSIQSIIGQDVRIILLNASKEDIQKHIKDMKVDYFYIPYGEAGMEKCKLINHSVKHYVKTYYAFLSDIDLVYPPNYVQEMIREVNKFEIRFRAPIRLIPHTFSLKGEYYSHDVNELIKIRIPFTEGIAPGNGIIHVRSFKEIQGFNEDLKGYGPEDMMFNLRIGKINKYIEAPYIKTFHLYHSKRKQIVNQDHINRIKCQEKFEKIREYSLDNPTMKRITSDTFSILVANDKNWGELI